jgi:hypothetical protein
MAIIAIAMIISMSVNPVLECVENRFIIIFPLEQNYQSVWIIPANWRNNTETKKASQGAFPD